MVISIDRWTNASIVQKLAAVSIVVFLILHIGVVICNCVGADPVIFSRPASLGCPSSFHDIACRPWTLITYSFTHYSLLHLLLNMLWLIWFGNLAEADGISDRRILSLYVISAICAALTYPVWFEMNDTDGSFMIGSSASVLSIGCAVAVMRPRSQVCIPYLPSIPVFIPVTVIILADIALFTSDNQGGHIAHIAGILTGICAGIIWQKKKSLVNLNSQNTDKGDINAKIITSGFESLSSAERNYLLDESESSKSYHNH